MLNILLVRISRELISAHEKGKWDTLIDKTLSFSNKAKRFAPMISDSDMVTKVFKEDGKMLCDWRDDLDIIIDMLTEKKSHKKSSHYKCELAKKYIEKYEKLFIKRFSNRLSGKYNVVKLQSWRTQRRKQQNVYFMRKVFHPMNLIFGSVAQTRLKGSWRNGARLEMKKTEYMDLSFIIGSGAMIERWWKHILTEDRNRLSPPMFEASIFLKLNARF